MHQHISKPSRKMMRRVFGCVQPLLHKRPAALPSIRGLRFLSTNEDGQASLPLSEADQAAIAAFERAMEEEGKVEADDATKAVDDYALLLASTREKMRLTVEWRGEAQTEKEIMVATARRVGLEIADTAPSRE